MGTKTLQSSSSSPFPETPNPAEEENSYGSTMLINPIVCDSRLAMDEMEDGDIWLEDLAGESPNKEAQRMPGDVLVMPPRRRLSSGSRRTFRDFTGTLAHNCLRSQTRSPAGRGESRDKVMELLSQSTGAINFEPPSMFQQPPCLVRSRALSGGAIDAASWKQSDRRRMSKGKQLQGVSTSLRALPRESEIQLKEENDSCGSVSVHTIFNSRSRSPGRRRAKTRERTMERFSKSTGDIDFSSSSIFQPRRGLVRSRTLSAGAGDGGSWKQTDRRRMPKGKHLNGISTSLRSLPRETELQLEEDASNEITPDKIEDEFQAIFDKIHQIDTKVKAVINMFPDEHRSCPPLLDAVAESSLRSERSEL